MKSICRQFEPLKILAAAGLVGLGLWVAEHRALAAQLGELQHDLGKVVFVAGPSGIIDAAERQGRSAGATLDGLGSLALANIPAPSHVGQVKWSEHQIGLVPMMPAQADRIAGNLEPVATSPDAAINANLGQSLGKPFGRINGITTARPELGAVPHDAAIADFLLPKPAAHPLSGQVRGQSHVAFVNHKVKTNQSA